MTKPWIMDARSRKRPVYINKHLELADDVREARKPEPTKRDRKMAAHLLFRQQSAP